MRTEVALLVVESLEELHAGETHSAATAKEPPTLAKMRVKLLKWEAKFIAAQSDATVKAVRADWRVFRGWCERSRACALPVTTENMLRFLTDMVVLGRKRATINRYLYTVREIHKAAGAPDPTVHEDWALEWKALVKRLTNAKRNAPRQARPLKQQDIARILEHLQDSPRDLRDGALISLASDTLCRESELAGVTLDLFEQDGSGQWTLHLGKIKNDQEGLGSYRFVSHETKTRVDAWCEKAGITEGYVFLPVGGRPKNTSQSADDLDASGRLAAPSHLRPAEVARILRRRAAEAGIPEANRVSGHSARVGSTIDMLEAGTSVKDAQYAGGWQTERMVMQYGKQARAGTNAMAQLRKRMQPLASDTPLGSSDTTSDPAWERASV